MDFGLILKLILALLKVIMDLPGDQQPAAIDSLISGVEEFRAEALKKKR